jgi:ATP-dependent RNA helicase DDX18/HAS1
MKFADMPLFD